MVIDLSHAWVFLENVLNALLIKKKDKYHLTQCPAVNTYRLLINVPPQWRLLLFGEVSLSTATTQGNKCGIIIFPPTIRFDIPPVSPHSVIRRKFNKLIKILYMQIKYNKKYSKIYYTIIIYYILYIVYFYILYIVRMIFLHRFVQKFHIKRFYLSD